MIFDWACLGHTIKRLTQISDLNGGLNATIGPQSLNSSALTRYTQIQLRQLL